MSLIMKTAFEQWQEMRDDFELRRHAQYERAAEELRGELLNRRGREQGIDPYSLFVGPSARVLAYASEELLEWWCHPQNQRVTVEEFEKQWVTARFIADGDEAVR